MTSSLFSEVRETMENGNGDIVFEKLIPQPLHGAV